MRRGLERVGEPGHRQGTGRPLRPVPAARIVRRSAREPAARDSCGRPTTRRSSPPRSLPAEVEEARRAAQALPWSAEAKEALEAVLRELAKEGIRPGDRRQFKTVGVVRAFAYLNGADEVRPEHLEVAQHCLWDDRRKSSRRRWPR